ncbi:hypothetical protein [Alteribacillus sp. YIM 98480]|uniref:hypothetical protein n=1 Tax=Alteribacillus sp. YIM 98480 TaxID=2606599 RepID=UPI00131CE560|nr:hypothetical protein [Alteribacillus sp. YIM 98480]
MDITDKADQTAFHFQESGLFKCLGNYIFSIVDNYFHIILAASSSSAYSLEIPSVRQWKAKISFPYADPPGLVAREQGACAFLNKRGYYETVLARYFYWKSIPRKMVEYNR